MLPLCSSCLIANSPSPCVTILFFLFLRTLAGLFMGVYLFSHAVTCERSIGSALTVQHFPLTPISKQPRGHVL